MQSVLCVYTAWKSYRLNPSPVLLVRWCGPCQILGPRLEKAVAKQKGRVAMAKVDIDDHTDLAIEYGVNSNVVVILFLLTHTCSLS